jgi:FlaA1/EpsC-like NDP-sugar epimerase
MNKYRNNIIMVVADAVLFACAYLGAYLIRFEFAIPADHMATLRLTIVPAILCKMAVAQVFGLYRGMWRYTSLSDLLVVLRAVAVGSLLIFSALLFARTESPYSRATLLLDGVLTFLFIGGFRVVIRLYFTHSWERFFTLDFYTRSGTDAAKLLIVGAGKDAEGIVRDMRNRFDRRYRVAGFVDDDPEVRGKLIHGYPVLGSIEDLGDIVASQSIDEVLIAKATATAREMRVIVTRCEEAGVKARIIPSVGEILADKVSLKSIRDVSFEDLLGRETVELELDRIGGYLKDRRVLVTGAGGSIGAELCRQIAPFDPAMLYLLDQSESALYDIEMELRHHPTLTVRHEPILADVSHRDRMRRIFDETRPEVVLHAAAYKHVPMLERYPWEAVVCNILGTRNLLELCREVDSVTRFVLVSSDKAVNPTNVMGATKRVAELLTQAYDVANPRTTHQSVRFGNVVGSAGSVIPLFRKQIESRGVVTVTHPDILRYFMSIPEASQLILQAGAMGQGGEIFILDMGEPIKIVDLARDLIRLSGFEPETDIPIEFIGLRPGEKLFEELITEGEGIVPTDHRKIMVLRPEETNGQLDALLDEVNTLSEQAARRDSEAIRATLQQLVPEYHPAPNELTA